MVVSKPLDSPCWVCLIDLLMVQLEMFYTITNKPKILSREDTCIHLCWDDVYSIENTENLAIKYKLQIDDKPNGWRTVYWGPRTDKRIDNLGVCTLYFFQLSFHTERYQSDWMPFKAGTDCGPYLIMHMTRALKIGNTSMIRKLAQLRPILLELENKELKTPLMQMIEKNDAPMVQFLINMGANVNGANLINKRTPLMCAIYAGRVQIAALLVGKGADSNATDINKLTPLHYAVDSDRIESVTFAVEEAGCAINTYDNKGWTPLMRAVILECNVDIINYLLKVGANVSIKDSCGYDFRKHCELNGGKYLNCLKELKQAN